MSNTQNSKYTKLSITSSSLDAEDYVGTWKKSDIELDIENILGRPIRNGTEWIVWILDRVLGNLDMFTGVHQNAVLDPSVKALTVEVDDGLVLTIKKEI